MTISKITDAAKTVGEYISAMVKWVLFSLITGVLCGLIGVLFHHIVRKGTHLRECYNYLLFLLPVAGVIIVFLYHICGLDNDKGTDTILLAVREKGKISPFLAPVIFAATALTHTFGGSSGREGAALQIGGGIGSGIAKLFRLKERNTSVLIMCGMSALFSAVFGTPVTAAIFTLEVASVGIMHYSVLFPALLSSLIAKTVALYFGGETTKFVLMNIPAFDYVTLIKVAVLSTGAGLLSILFIVLMHETTKLGSKLITNKYLKIISGAVIVIILTCLVGNFNYNGAGMDVITAALESGTAPTFAFILKIVFTVITLSSGFKGGEIVPSFYIGSTFGVTASVLLGLNSSFSAAIGLIAFFCGVVNCPLAAIVLSIELFGAEGLLYFAAAVAVSYVISGNYSLYSSQRIVYSKIHSSFVEENTIC